MDFLFSIISAFPYIDLPNNLTSWCGLIIIIFLLLLILKIGVKLSRKQKQLHTVSTAGEIFSFIALAVIEVLTSLFIGLKFPFLTSLPQPGLPVEPVSPIILLFSAVPWAMAGGILGIIPATILGFINGLVLSLWSTHSPFSPFEIAIIASTFTIFIRQQYRTSFFCLLRHPLFSAFCLIPIYLLFSIYDSFFSVNDTLAVRLGYALTQSWAIVLMRWAECLIACAFGELLAYVNFQLHKSIKEKDDKPRANIWVPEVTLIPSPSEGNLQYRLLGFGLPISILLLITMVVSVWVISGNVARRLLQIRLSGMADVASSSLPYFLETGQSIIQSMSNPNLLTMEPNQLSTALEQNIHTLPYFRQLILFDAKGMQLSQYPSTSKEQYKITQEETAGIKLAIKGIPVQIYTGSPFPGENAARITFLSSITDTQGQVVGLLLARTDLASNPFTQSVIKALDNINQNGGDGYVLDETHRILYHASSSSSLIMSEYIGKVPEYSEYFEDISPSGARKMVFYLPVEGRHWSVLLTVPSEQMQKMTLEIMLPLLVLVILSLALLLIGLKSGLQKIVSSLSSLTNDVVNFSQGKLDHSLNVHSGGYQGRADEIGKLGSALEKMRISLKARLDEMNRMLLVTQGMATELRINKSTRPLLEAAIGNGASSARLVLIKDVVLSNQHDSDVSSVDRLEGQISEWNLFEETETSLIAFGSGKKHDLYAYLDRQLFEVMRSQDIFSVPNTSRLRSLFFLSGHLKPGAIIAFALRQDDKYYGVLWIAYNQIHQFSDDETHILSTLASQATLAAANACLFASAEIGKQRLEAVLSSTPDPILVFDENMALLLVNHASLQVPGLLSCAIPGTHIKDVVALQELLALFDMHTDDGQIQSIEIDMPDGRIYYASVSSVFSGGEAIEDGNSEDHHQLAWGKVCLLRDITHYKQMDILKSDFVATVSHDLRSPLTLMHGYTTMLQMVGSLNEQQQSYVEKIISGLDEMSRLVNNLLDLGRIEAGIGLQIEEVSTSHVIESVIEVVKPKALQKKIDLKIKETHVEDKIFLEADFALLKQAILNLVENAIKFTAINGQVGVSVSYVQVDNDGLESEIKRRVRFEVYDNGIGIAPLDLPHMFEKFYRSGRREGFQNRGSGLGLAIVKSIAERHHGKAWVVSQLGKGSAFFIEIPEKQSPHAESDQELNNNH